MERFSSRCRVVALRAGTVCHIFPKLDDGREFSFPATGENRERKGAGQERMSGHFLSLDAAISLGKESFTDEQVAKTTHLRQKALSASCSAPGGASTEATG